MPQNYGADRKVGECDSFILEQAYILVMSLDPTYYI